QQQACRKCTGQRRSKRALHPNGKPLATLTSRAAILPASFLVGAQHVVKAGTGDRTGFLLRRGGKPLPHLEISAAVSADLKMLARKRHVSSPQTAFAVIGQQLREMF